MARKPTAAKAADNVVALRPDVPPPPSSSARSTPTEAPAARGTPTPPAWLTPTGGKVFRELVAAAELVAPGYLTKVDEPLVAMFAHHYATLQGAAKSMTGAGGHLAPIDADRAHGGRPRKHPGVQVARDATAASLALLNALTLTPSARERAELNGPRGFVPEAGDGETDGDLYDA